MSRTARKRAVQKNLPGVLLLITAGIVLGLITLLLYHLIGKPAYHLIADPLIAREWIGQFGLKGYLLFIFIMFLQIVIAVIPGEPLEIAAGLVFGPVVGTILCFIGILLGSIVTFMLTRIFGMKLLRMFFSERALQKLDILHKNNDTMERVVFVAFVMPGTPKDLLAYAIGLTDLSLKSWIVITSLARFPSIVTSTFGGGALSNGQYGLAIAIFTIGTLVSFLLYFIYDRQKQ